MKYESGNSALLIAYRKALHEAFKLGEDIRKVYSIVPPAVLLDEHEDDRPYRVSLNVSRGLPTAQIS